MHSFSLVHDDLPALDDDRERRGAPSVWAAFDEATAILAGDALLAEAFRLALTYPTAAVARELVGATIAMIGGQQLDLEGEADLRQLHALKTGSLFSASVMCALWAADVSIEEHPPWREFAEELGLLFQVVDDVLDGDGFVLSVGEDGARRLADEAAGRAQARLAEIDADVSVPPVKSWTRACCADVLAPMLRDRFLLRALLVGEFISRLGPTTTLARCPGLCSSRLARRRR